MVISLQREQVNFLDVDQRNYKAHGTIHLACESTSGFEHKPGFSMC